MSERNKVSDAFAVFRAATGAGLSGRIMIWLIREKNNLNGFPLALEPDCVVSQVARGGKVMQPEMLLCNEECRSLLAAEFYGARCGRCRNDA